LRAARRHYQEGMLEEGRERTSTTEGLLARSLTIYFL
jgi:hypothetical protein